MLGWTYKEIADIMGLKIPGVQSIYEKFNIKEIINSYPNKPIEELAAYHKLDEATTWAIVLQDKTDLERFKLLDITAKVYDVWNFSGCNKLLGSKSDSRACQFGRHNSKVSLIEP